MADIANIGIAADSSQLVKMKADLLAVVPAASSAAKATDQFNRSQDSAKASVAAASAGVTAQTGIWRRWAGAVMGAPAALGRAAAGFFKVRDAAEGANATLNKFNTSGIAAQFQDIAVTAQMGMSPLQIALQQGTQLVGQLSTMDRPLQTIASSLLSLISPLSLITLGLVALAAVGLQSVNWMKVAETSLNWLADRMDTIAPVAAIAAGGLALFFAPAIIGGFASLTMMLANLARQAIITGAAMMVANPVGAIVFGITAALAAMVIFRDQIAQIVGRDIVGDVKNGVNMIIGAFVGGFNGIKATWSLLPAAIGDLVIQSVNNTIGAIEGMLNFITGSINSFIANINGAIMMVPEQFRGGWTGLGTVGDVSFGRVENSNAGAASAVAGTISGEMSAAMGTDYVGALGDLIQRGASVASGALSGLADAAGAAGTATDKAAESAAKLAEEYTKIIEGGRQFIAEQELEASVLGQSEQRSNALRYAQEMLNKAKEAGIQLTAAQRNEIMALSDEMSQAEATTKALTEAYNFGKGLFGSFFSDLKNGLTEGQSVWESFGNAALNVLNKVADKLLGMAADGLFDMLFNGLTSGMGGGAGSGLGSWIGKLFGFSDGGYTGGMGRDSVAGVVHGQEYVMNAEATRRIGVSTLDALNHGYAANDNSSGGGMTYIDNRVFTVDARGNDNAQDIGDVVEEVHNRFPDWINEYNADPRRRKAS